MWSNSMHTSEVFLVSFCLIGETLQSRFPLPNVVPQPVAELFRQNGVDTTASFHDGLFLVY